LVYSQVDNKLYIPVVESGAGKTASVPVYMSNESGIVAVQFKLHVPQGITINDNSLIQLTDRKDNHTLSVKNLGNNDFLFIIFSLTNASLRGNSGTLIQIPVAIADTCSAGTLHPFNFSQIILSKITGENATTLSDPGAIKIIAEPKPDLTVTDITSAVTSVNPGNKITIAWKIRNVGNLSTSYGWSEQVSLVSDNGESVYLGTVNNDQLLDAGGIVIRQADFIVPKYTGIEGKAKVFVKVVPNSTAGELLAAQYNNTAKSNDYVAVGHSLFLIINKSAVAENDLTQVSCQLFRSGSRATEQTFTIISKNEGRLKVPSSVTIPVNSSGAVFYVSSIDNQTLNTDSFVVISASGNNYSAVLDTIQISDNEIPSLTISSSKTDLSEGDTFSFTVERELVTTSPLKVSLSTDYSKRFSFSSDLIIPAGEKLTTVNVACIDDAIPALTVSPTFTSTASGYNKGTKTVTLADNDVPVIGLSIVPGSVTESAGYQSAIGVVSRQGATDNVITIKLTDNSNGELYYSTPTITLEKGESQKQFTVGIVDNALVDGNKDFVITASVYISACGCSASGTGAGTVVSKLTLLDDDGPALKITSSQTMLAEGKTQATTLTVTRNTATTLPLSVSITTDHPNDLTFDKTIIIIPAGSTSVSVPVGVNSNSTIEGDRTVTFTAETTGYTKGVCWAMITDQTLPDATVTINNLSANSFLTKGVITAEIKVDNVGVSALSSGTTVNVYLCNSTVLSSASAKQLLTTLSASKQIEAGGSETLSSSLNLPDLTGSYYLIATVDESQLIKELSYLNNTSSAQPIQLLPAYTASVSTDKKTYNQGQTIVLTGKTIAEESSSVAAVLVDVYVINNGYRQTLTVTTDANGVFTTNFTPYSGQMGHFQVGACYPGQGLTIEQASFDIYGLKQTTTDNIIWEVLSNEQKTGEIEISNPGNLPLTGLKTAIVTNPATGLTLTFDALSDLAAGGIAKLKYTLTGTTVSSGTQYEQIKFKVSTNEGATLDLKGYYYCRSPKATLKVNLPSIQTTMTKGETRTYPFIITNTGKGASGKISVVIPSTSWLSLASPSEIPSLDYGQSTTVSLQLTPTDDMLAHTSVTGTIGVNCENGNGFPLAFNIETVSEKTGSLEVDVCDEYTYYTSASPHLSGAKVVVKHPFTGQIYAQGTTDANGLFSAENLAEGYYTVVVTADKHDSYQNNILVDPGKSTKTTVNLSFQAISYTWNVVETTVQDVYNVETTVKYETNVPVPVVEVKYPDDLPYKNQLFNVYATNKGLIAAKNVIVTIPEVEGVKFEFLTPNPIPELLPQQSMAVSVRMIVEDETLTYYKSKRAQIGIGNSESSTLPPSKIKSGITDVSSKCLYIYLKTDWYWYCGELKSAGTSTIYKYGECPSGLVSGAYYSSQPNGTGTPSPSTGYTGGTYSGTSSGTIPVVSVSKDCDECANKMRTKMLECGVGFIPVVGCLYGSGTCARDAFQTNGNMNFFQKMNCNLAGIGCTSEFIPVVGTEIGIASNILGCLISFLEPCNESQVSKVSGKYLIKTESVPSYISTFQTNIKFGQDELNAISNLRSEILKKESWLNCSNQDWNKFYSYIQSKNIENEIVIDENLNYYKPSSITYEDFMWFVERWNNTIKKEKGIDIQGDNYINKSLINEYNSIILSSEQVATNLGFSSMKDLMENEFNELNNKLRESSNSVCSSISLQFSQTMTMTRQAFHGTLSVYNGHEAASMQNVQLNLVVKDSEGNIVIQNNGGEIGNQMFQINAPSLDKLTAIDGTGTLNAKETGTANIQFIPTKYAAPLVSKAYTFGGTLSYLDPFTNTTVTRNLYPVTLIVKPSPDLTLDYFMQRDVLGDNPLTTDMVEHTEPAEFSLLINNVGAGDAMNVHFTTSQPQIVQNEKGLLNEFKLIESSMNGAEKTVNFSDNDFGTIASGKTSYVQWWFTSNLLGHFVDYDTKVTHVTSYGNPDLSLVSNVGIHELIRSLNIPGTNGTALTGFLANDITDAEDLPDILYLSDGTKSEVNIATNVVFTKTDNNKYSMLVTPNKKGWNYGVFDDPGNGKLTLTSVILQSDNTIVSMRNFWQTDRTLRDGKDPLFENKIHFADNIENASETYLLTFEPRRDNILSVKSFSGIPDGVSKTAITKINVTFSKAIDKSTFSSDDISITCKGKALDVSKVTISPVSGSEYSIDLSQIAEICGNGYFVMTVQTKNITDDEGFQGETGKQSGWNQYVDSNVQLTVQVSPAGSGNISPETSRYNYGDIVSFKATSNNGYYFKNWTIDGNIVSTKTDFNFSATEQKTITANFEAKYYNVTIQNDNKQGSVSGIANGLYQYGNSLNLNATPLANYSFVNWKVNGVIKTTSTSLNLIIDQDQIIEAIYKEKQVPVIIWNNPANIIFGTKLSEIQLNAKSDIPGIYIFNPNIGTILEIGNNQILKVDFIPTDTESFQYSSKTVTINVLSSITTTNLSDIQDIKIFPNPTNKKVEITQFGESGTKLNIEILNINGEIIYSKNISNQESLISIDLSNHPNGLYLVKISNNKNTISRKLIKK
jgi:hypothetical protein